MEHSGKPVSESKKVDSLSDRLRQSVSCTEDGDKKDGDKPDFRELDLGSPVSPLRTRRRGGLTPTTTATTTTTTTTTTTSSSSSSSGSVSCRNAPGPVPKKSGSSHSGELSAESSPTAGRGFKQGHSSPGRGFKQGHSSPTAGRGHAGSHSSGAHPPSIHSGGGSVNSPPPPVLPAGNICPSGRVVKTGMASRSTKTDVLGLGGVHYGVGSIMRRGGAAKSASEATPAASSRGIGGESARKTGLASSCNDPEELKRLGNDSHKKGNFAEALKFYDRAIALSPGNAAFHCNRAAALIGLKQIGDAIRECEEAIRLDPKYARAHHRLGNLLLSLGQVEDARKHICLPGYQADHSEIQKLQAVERHLRRCTDARRVNDWKITLREAEAAIAAGVDNSPQLLACKAEALLNLQKLDDANSYLSSISKLYASDTSKSQSKFFGMPSDAYLYFVRAQIELALGRFENALAAAETAGQIDIRNVEISVLLSNVRRVSRARGRGNDLFKSERFTEACAAYAEGLRIDPSNSVLYCNRAACRHKLGEWDLSVEDCNKALAIQPDYTKALLRRAASYFRLERWDEAVRDYEKLRRELPYDKEVAESLFHAQVALKKSRGEDVSNMKFGGEVELMSSLEQFRAEISSPGASVVHFLSSSDQQCKKISPFLDTLCAKYPMINFLKVDVEESPMIANAESVRVIPTFKIYKKSSRVKEMVCPSPEVLEASVKHYST